MDAPAILKHRQIDYLLLNQLIRPSEADGIHSAGSRWTHCVFRNNVPLPQSGSAAPVASSAAVQLEDHGGDSEMSDRLDLPFTSSFNSE